ncbi:MAG: hypothetical protein LBE59_06905 [Nevskiaceae bacterium]|jgi:uncharacterized membrane protein SirB2|nr:hypothetical protein [Nevskiaceae bacterium]
MFLDFATWLGGTALSVAFQSHTWLIALLQSIHILAIGVIFTSMVIVALRVLGKVRSDETLDVVWARFSPLIWGSLAVLAATGLFLAVGEPVREASALSFWLKMLLIVAAIAGALMLKRRPSHGLAWAMILVWLFIIFLGRAIAYDVEVWGSWHLGGA